MTAKEYLEQVYKLDHKIYLMQLEVEEYHRLAKSIPGQDFSHERVDGTRSFAAPFEKWIYKAIDKEREIKQRMEELVKLKSEVMSVIDTIENDNYRLVLKLRYIDSLQWNEIASKIYASDKTVRRWHNAAIAEIKVPSINGGTNEQV